METRCECVSSPVFKTSYGCLLTWILGGKSTVVFCFIFGAKGLTSNGET